MTSNPFGVVSNPVEMSPNAFGTSPNPFRTTLNILERKLKLSGNAGKTGVRGKKGVMGILPPFVGGRKGFSLVKKLNGQTAKKLRVKNLSSYENFIYRFCFCVNIFF